MRRITHPTLTQAIRDAGIRNFTADEFLYLGAAHWAGTVRNEAPPADLLCNLLAVGREADKLRDDCGFPLLIISAYRCPDYNAAVGGEERSWHLRAAALDITPQDPANIGDLIEIATDRANTPAFFGGLGTYSTFVHIDIGPHRRW